MQAIGLIKPKSLFGLAAERVNYAERSSQSIF
jgi:hypothetical protein